ncbi:MAG: DUF2231 domain-containing protein [Methylococcaceae bacterium]
MIDVNDFLSFQVHGSAGGHKAGDGIAGGVEALLTFLEGLVGLEPSEMFFAIFPGISAMANIHPVLVHFPIAFIISFFIIDLVGSIINNDNWRRLAAGLLYLGVISAAAAVVAGLMAAGSVDHGENVHLIMNKHKSFGFSVLGLSIVLALWRLLSGSVIKGVNNLLFLTFAALLNILIMLGADLGGLMVYKHGVAVEAVEVTSMDYFHEHTHTH